jgi:GTPase SAR1 family protein
MAVFSDGQRALVGCEDKYLRVLDLRRGIELRKLDGHARAISCVKLLSNGLQAVSASVDRSVMLWDLNIGVAQRKFIGHDRWVTSVEVLPDQGRILSTSADGTLRLWNLESGAELWRLTRDTDFIWSIALLVDGRQMIFGSRDGTLRLWDIEKKEEIRHLKGRVDHGDFPHAVKSWDYALTALAVSADGQCAVSGSEDNTLGIWDLKTGENVAQLRGHTGPVRSVAMLPGGRKALSGSDDATLRLWDLESRKELWRFEGHTASVLCMQVLEDGRQVLSGSADKTIKLWDVDLAGVTDGSGTVAYTTARLALLGESGVGKTGLGYRVAKGAYREHDSSHGQQFWVIDQLHNKRTDGAECEAVLWDLAGQADYRLIHALFLDQVDLGLLVFDAADRDRPLSSVEYWVRHLRSATSRGDDASPTLSSSTYRGAPTLLIAARSDRGFPSISLGDIHDLCHQYDISGYFVTSARENQGISELLDKLKATIPWDHLPATTSTVTFKKIKEYVLQLKETVNTGDDILLYHADLQQRLEISDPKWRFSSDEMTRAIIHLGNHGYIAKLQNSDGKELILLVPDLLLNLAASMVLEARRHERGLGLLDELRLFSGGYRLPELSGFSVNRQAIMLDVIVSLCLQRTLCFRELVNDRSHLVFPSLINERRPYAIDAHTIDDVSYIVKGSVDTVYASLVVQLGYTNLFWRDHHWQDQAQYELEPDEICCFRQTAEKDGEIELTLSYSENTSQDTRSLFRSVFERFLKRRKVNISRLPPVSCTNQHRQDKAAIRRAIGEGRPTFFCSSCGEQLATPKTYDIGLPALVYADTVGKATTTADRRTEYEVAVTWVKAFRRERDEDSRPSCFISYAWGDQRYEQWVERLAEYLQNADVAVIFDRWHNIPGSSISRFIERIASADFVCAIGTPGYKLKDDAQTEDPVVQAELRFIKTRLRKRDSMHGTILPILVDGTQQTAFPPSFEDSVFIDFRSEEKFFPQLFELILVLQRIPHEYELARRHRDAISQPSRG